MRFDRSVGAIGVLCIVVAAGCNASVDERQPVPGSNPAAALPWDFDGDGTPDLAVGLPGDHEGGVSGRVEVRYGTDSGPSPTGPVLFDPAEDEVYGVPRHGFGASLASADIDVDGYADLLVLESSTYGETELGGMDADSLTIFYGSSGLSRMPTVLTEKLLGFDLNGAAVATTDANGDGWPDIALSTRRDGPIILRGGEDGFVAHGISPFHVPMPSGQPAEVANRVIAVGDVDGDGHEDLVSTVAGSGPSGFGLMYAGGTSTGPLDSRVLTDLPAAAVVVADVTGDGVDDVVAGFPATGLDVATKRAAGVGRVMVFPGGPSGPGAAVTVSQSTAGVPGRAEDGDLFGASLAVADVDGDGRNELLVGAPGEDVGATADVGTLTVLSWDAQGLARHGNAVLRQGSGGIPGELGDSHRFATQLAAIDLTGDGQVEVLATVPGEPGARPHDERGAVRVLEPLSSAGSSGTVRLHDDAEYQRPVLAGESSTNGSGRALWPPTS